MTTSLNAGSMLPMYANGYFWGFANATSSLNHQGWMSYSLWKSRNGISDWTEDTTNAPYLQAFGSIFANPTKNAVGSGYDTGTVQTGHMTFTSGGCPVPVVVNATTTGAGAIASATYVSGSCTAGNWPTTTGWVTSSPLSAGTGATFTWASVAGTGIASLWQLHPAWLPYGCTISSTFHKFCVLYGASGIFNFATFMAWSDTINGVYTPVGCTGPCNCLAPTPVIVSIPATVPPGTTYDEQNLPSVDNVGGSSGTNYIITAESQGGNCCLNAWKTPGTPTGAVFTWSNLALTIRLQRIGILDHLSLIQ